MIHPSKIYQLELKVLFEICAMIGQILSLDHALASILEILSKTLSMERATVTLKDDDTGMLKIRASHNLSPAEIERGTYQPGEGITGRIFHSGQPFAVPDIGKEPLFLNRTGSRDDVIQGTSFIGVPIVLHAEVIGVLSVDRLFNTDVSFKEDIRFLTIVATLISQFVHLNREVEKRESSLRNENRLLRAEISAQYNHFFAVGVSPAMQALNKMIKKVAPSRALVLLLGESGTGKTLTARIIHELSSRARGPFVKVNCAALPENLIEAELFGYEKGAFTGAASTKKGKLEQADKGTVFLDEIGELTPAVQAKLLNFIQERELERLGGTVTRTVDVRIIAATNVDLGEAVDQGRFRADLFYRLNVFPVSIPPLRERRSDIPLLATYFLDKTAKEYGRRLQFAADAMRALVNYHWPGNVRELENLIERISILAEKVDIEKGDLPSYLVRKNQADYVVNKPSNSRLEEIERQTLVDALSRNNWIQQRAAREVGLTLRQMGYRVKKFGLDELIRREKNRGQSSA